jgi:hypothetical protein
MSDDDQTVTNALLRAKHYDDEVQYATHLHELAVDALRAERDRVRAVSPDPLGPSDAVRRANEYLAAYGG